MNDKYIKEVDGEWYLQELQKEGGMKWIQINFNVGINVGNKKEK